MTRILGSLLHGLDVLDVRGNLDIVVEGLSYDSRKTRQGDVFVAVRGTRLDGGRFIKDAISRGAKAVIAESTPENGAEVAFVHVSDSRKALARLSANYFGHPSSDLQLIGVTGTNGKTTTTLLLESILRKQGYSVGVLGTLAYRWADKHIKAPMTTPESFDLQKLFSEMRGDCVSHVVMEVSSHALALGRVEGCSFRAGVFTNLSQDHLDFHATMEDYFRAKSLLFGEHLASESGPGIAVINGDDPYGMRLMDGSSQDVWSYSANRQDTRVFVKNAELNASGIRAELCTPSGPMRIRSPLLGRLNLYNVLCAATTAIALGVSGDAVCEGLEALSFVDGRLQRVAVPVEWGCEVVVDYAHTPDAMEKSLNCLREMTKNRLLAVFGCGGDRDRGKRPLMGEVAARLADVVVLTSDNPRSEVPESIIEDIRSGVQSAGLPFFEPNTHPSSRRGYTVEVDRRRAIGLALTLAAEGDTVFIGGKGHETYQIVAGQVHSFDDRQVVADYFSEKIAPGVARAV